MDQLRKVLKQVIPKPLFETLQPLYHRALARIGAIIYRHPSKEISVIGVTGTKGKSTTIEILSAILEGAGYKTALASTIRFKIGAESIPNPLKMTMPGRFFIQKFLREAVRAECQYAIVEMTSEGAKQFRHCFIDLNALIFTNLSAEHIEAHGSLENYFKAKYEIAKQLERSSKKEKVMVSNKDDEYGRKFLDVNVSNVLSYSLSDAKPYTLKNNGSNFIIEGVLMESPLIGEFNLYNVLAAVTLARHWGIALEKIKSIITHFPPIRGRVEFIEEGQNFSVIVDYAHTPDSLEKLYKAFSRHPKIGILGNTGGGRDKWKRPVMGALAERYCKKVILTNEDPYDEDPHKIVNDMANGMKEVPEIIIDRREAIRKAIKVAERGDVVLITGKGTDPYIMGPRGKRVPWDDAEVAREELRRTLTLPLRVAE